MFLDPFFLTVSSPQNRSFHTQRAPIVRRDAFAVGPLHLNEPSRNFNSRGVLKTKDCSTHITQRFHVLHHNGV